jgi:signal transduction histidine kinase
MRYLHDLADEYEESLLARWHAATGVEGAPRVSDATRREVGEFLQELRFALRRAIVEGAPVRAPLETRDGGHLETDAAGVTRAFGALHCALLELAAERGVVVSAAEQVTLADHVSGAAAAVVERRLRDRRDQAWKTSHQLRNPLGSAMMALTLLRSRVDFGESARLVETLERNLGKLKGLVEASTTEREARPDGARGSPPRQG